MTIVPLTGELTWELPGLRFAIPHSGMAAQEQDVARVLIERSRVESRWVACTVDDLVDATLRQQIRRVKGVSTRHDRNQLRRMRFQGRSRTRLNMTAAEIRQIIERLVSPEGMCRLRLDRVAGRQVVCPTRSLLAPTR